MLQNILNAIFGCSHRRTTFPLTPVRRGAARHSTYIACLDCGKELEYNWGEMRTGAPVEARVPAGEAAPIFRLN
jgi:hypothetical protein